MAPNRAPDRFTLAVTAAAFVTGTLLVLGQAPILYAIPPLLAAVAYTVARRFRADLVRTRHQYALFAPRDAMPGLDELARRLRAHGYRPDLTLLDDTGRPLGAAPAGKRLAGEPVRLREERAAADLGEIVLTARREPDGRVVVLLDADDTGPGLYEEMAQFVIVELGDLYGDAEFLSLADRVPARRKAQELRAGLPARPLGLEGLN